MRVPFPPLTVVCRLGGAPATAAVGGAVPDRVGPAAGHGRDAAAAAAHRGRGLGALARVAAGRARAAALAADLEQRQTERSARLGGKFS